MPEPVVLSCSNLRFLWKCACGFVFMFHPAVTVSARARKCSQCSTEYVFEVKIPDDDPMGVPDWLRALLKPATRPGPCQYAACKEGVESNDENKAT